MSVIPRFLPHPIRRQDEEEEAPAEPDAPAAPEPPAAPEAPGAGDSPSPGKLHGEPETFYMPIYIATGIFWAIFIFGPLFVRKGPNAGITRCCIMLTTVTLWLFWVTVYIGQMNPLLGPRLHNCTLAWVGYRWGKDAKSLGGESEESEL